MFKSETKPTGDLQIRVIRGPEFWKVADSYTQKVGLGWKLRNNLTWDYIKGWIANEVIAKITRKWFDLLVFTSELRIKQYKADGRVIDYGVVSRRSITDEGVAMIVDDWQADAADITFLKYHGYGTGTVAATGADTNLGTAISTAARATGTQTQPSAKVLQSVCTPTFDAALSITEHGLFDTDVVSGDDIMWDRHTFAVITTANGDSVEFTYSATLVSSG